MEDLIGGLNGAANQAYTRGRSLTIARRPLNVVRTSATTIDATE